MKKLMIVAAVAALGFTACTVNDITVDHYENTAIDFGTYIGQSLTKSPTTAVASPAKNYVDGSNLAYMTVNAYHTGSSTWLNYAAAAADTPNFMHNEFVTRGKTGDTYNDNWTYSPAKYWPANDKVSFFAISANFIGQTLTEQNYPKITGKKYTFQQPNRANLTEQVDLLHASALNLSKGKTGNQDNKVHFNFKHTLSRIGFSAVSGITGDNHKYTKMVIDKIVIGDATHPSFVVSGELTVVQSDGAYTWGAWKQGVSNSEAIQYTLTKSTTESSNDFHPEGFNLLPSIDETTGENPASSPAKINAEDKYIMIIPYYYKGNNIEIPVTVHYTVYTGTKEVTDTTPTEGITTYSTSAEFKVSENFTQGKAYRINFIVTPEEVEFGSMTVTDWHTTAESSNNNNPETTVTPTES